MGEHLRKSLAVYAILIIFGISLCPSSIALKSDVSSNITPINKCYQNPLLNWTQQAKILPKNGAAEDCFGQSVSISGNTAIIGAPYHNFNGSHSGSAYIFTFVNNTWIQQQELHSSDESYDNIFGRSVSIDGDTALIGAIYGNGTESYSGAAYVFTRNGNSWIQQAKLIASDGQNGDYFGYSVCILNDIAFVGAPSDNDNGLYSGSVYVFNRTGTVWIEQQKLLASDGAYADFFGSSLSLYGNTTLIGCYGDDDGIGPCAGSAYIFTRSGSTWTQQQRLSASDAAYNDRFGMSVALTMNTALIGSYLDDDNGIDSGSAYVFKFMNNSWTQQQKLLAHDGAYQDNFGISVAMNDNYALIGAYSHEDHGSVYVFNKTNSWIQDAEINASHANIGDAFGYSVSLSGNTSLIGAMFSDDMGDSSGSAYVFKGPNLSPNTPSIKGPTWGIINTGYNFSSTIIDPSGDTLFCLWDWGDGNVSSWLGPYSSEQTVTLSHNWTQTGTYEIRLKLKNLHGHESNWSDYHGIQIHELKESFIFGKYLNLTSSNGYYTIQAKNIWVIQFKPFKILHEISEGKIMFSIKFKGILTSQSIIGLFIVVK